VRIGRVDTVDVAIDLAALGPQCGRQGDGRGVGAPATQGGDFAVTAHSLVTRHDHDLAPVELASHALGPDFQDPGVEMLAARDDPGL
jgi:hypothetical protein